jgi:hypothetical protein
MVQCQKRAEGEVMRRCEENPGERRRFGVILDSVQGERYNHVQMLVTQNTPHKKTEITKCSQPVPFVADERRPAEKQPGRRGMEWIR